MPKSTYSTGVKRGSVIATKSGKLRCAVALLTLLGCDHEISKTWDSGGKLEAKVSAQTCSSAQPCPSSGPLRAERSCTPFGNAAEFGFNSVFEMDLVGSLFPTVPQRPRTEIWSIGCGQRCVVAMLRPSNVDNGAVGEGALSAVRGEVTQRRGDVFEIRLEDMGTPSLVVNLERGTASFEAKTKIGGHVTGQGRCK